MYVPAVEKSCCSRQRTMAFIAWHTPLQLGAECAQSGIGQLRLDKPTEWAQLGSPSVLWCASKCALTVDDKRVRWVKQTNCKPHTCLAFQPRANFNSCDCLRVPFQSLVPFNDSPFHRKSTAFPIFVAHTCPAIHHLLRTRTHSLMRTHTRTHTFISICRKSRARHARSIHPTKNYQRKAIKLIRCTY